MHRSAVVGVLFALLLSACVLGPATPGESAVVSEEPMPPAAGASIPLCPAVERISAPADWYADSPIYVANEQPTEVIRAWAAGKPGFEEIWVDRDRFGWITLAFSVDAEARQAELRDEFPGIGVVAVDVDWTMAELHELQRRVDEEIAPLFPVSSAIYPMQGVVGIGVGVLEPERIAAVEEHFAGEPICIEGADPKDVPAAGPQPGHGDGWRLLADEQGIGQAYRTGIATDRASYEQLWTDVGLSGELPLVDFETEVAIWFGAVYGSSCPTIRLDDVVVDQERAIVHAEIVLIGGLRICTSDANPHAYVAAVKRARLPSGPFAIQLASHDPPAAAPEERTVVDVDLSPPGAVAAPGDVHPDPALPEPF